MNDARVEALDQTGRPYVREARVVNELPTPEARYAALESATLTIARRLSLSARSRIQFGAPVYVAFGLTRAQARDHAQAKVLMSMGADLPLDLDAGNH